MTAAVIPQPNRRLLLWAWRILFACGILLLGYCAFVLAGAWQFQRNESREFSRLQSGQPAGAVTDISSAAMGTDPEGLVGRVNLQRLGISVIVMEGSDERTLGHAAGHITGTALPGESGNIGISAHRDTFFRALKDVRQHDIITFTTLEGEFRYRVVLTKVVEPSDLSVLDSDGRDVLTLVTCYPFYFVGPAPERFVVRAERVD